MEQNGEVQSGRALHAGCRLGPNPEFGEGGGDTNVVLIQLLTSLLSLDHSVLLDGSERAVWVK